jgi:hypothetical protein
MAVISILVMCVPAQAHVTFNQFDLMTGKEAGWYFFAQGFQHILPLGFDHILFVLSLYLLSPKWSTILKQATAFTVAHSLTLGMAMYGVIEPPSNVIEPLIAISIVAVALENIISPKLRTSRLGVVFLFGLVHGLGFAGALSELGLPQKHFLTTLLSFNAGVELGQIAVIVIAYILVGRWFSGKEYYHRRVVVPISAAIILMASYWTVERIFFA